jgi:hypothetical protein
MSHESAPPTVSTIGIDLGKKLPSCRSRSTRGDRLATDRRQLLAAPTRDRTRNLVARLVQEKPRPINSRPRMASASSPPSNSATSDGETVMSHGLSEGDNSSVQRSTGDNVTVTLPSLKSCVLNVFRDVLVSTPVVRSKVRFVAIRPR